MSSEDNHWHIDKRVSVTHLLTTISMVAVALWWAGDIDTRIAVLKNTMTHDNQRIEEIREDVKEIKRMLMGRREGR